MSNAADEQHRLRDTSLVPLRSSAASLCWAGCWPRSLVLYSHLIAKRGVFALGQRNLPQLQNEKHPADQRTY